MNFLREIGSKVLSLPVVLAGLVTLILVQGYNVVAPERPDYSPRQLVLAENAAEKVGLWVDSLPESLERGRMVFPVIAGDRFGILSAPVRGAVFRSDRFALADRTFAVRFREAIKWDLPVLESDEDLMAFAERKGAEYALWGRVLELSEVDGMARLTLQMDLWDVAQKEQVARKSFSIVKKASLMHPIISDAATEDHWPYQVRFAVWVFTAAFLPVFLFVPCRWVLQTQGNLGIFTLWQSLSVFSSVLASVLLGISVATLWGMVALIAIYALMLVLYLKTLTLFKEYA